jgi:hypothetical protein
MATGVDIDMGGFTIKCSKVVRTQVLRIHQRIIFLMAAA